LKRSTVFFLVFALALAAGCIRLGIWQLDRRQQRQRMNARIAERMAMPPRPVSAIDPDTTKSRFALATVVGTPDYANEFVLTYRGNDGAPGVDVMTPMRIAGRPKAVLVNRGWVYSPDAARVDLERWREPRTSFTGYVESFVSAPADTVRDGGIRKASYEAIARQLPYPIEPFYVVALGDSAYDADSTRGTPRIVRLARPKLDGGPHLSYAFQWFGFATIALIGAAVVTARSMQKTST
jgi:surfeit locus 1 family protein